MYIYTLNNKELIDLLKIYGPQGDRNKENIGIFQKHFSFSFPSENIINEIKDFVGKNKVLEIGAGRGLHSKLLKDKGVNIISTNKHNWKGYFTNVEQIDYKKALKKYPTNYLLLIWPPYELSDDKNFSDDILKIYRGKYLIYIGEDSDGATGSNKFHLILKSNWNLIKEVSIENNFVDSIDKLFIYEKIKN